MWEKNKELGSSGKLISLMDALGVEQEDVIFLSLNDDCSKCPRRNVKWHVFFKHFEYCNGRGDTGLPALLCDCQNSLPTTNQHISGDKFVLLDFNWRRTTGSGSQKN